MTTFLVLGTLAVCTVPAQERRVTRADGAADRRLALVIGNQAYPDMPLKNAAQDARDMHAALFELGFEAELVIDATERQLRSSVDGFVARLRPGDVALVYYAGHGVQIGGENYLIPVDAQTADEPSIRHSSYSAALLHDRLADRGARLKIIVLDACRNNPFRMARSAAQGLAPMAAPGRGTFIAFATGPGNTADDNVAGRNGLFTAALLDAIREPGLDLGQVFDRVRERVDDLSRGRQTPWSNSSVIGRFVFRAGHAASATTADASSPPSRTAPRPRLVAIEPAVVSAPLDIGRAPARGRDDAPITLVEIADFHCPFCRRHAMQTQPQIDAEYVDRGKLRHVFLHFPLAALRPDVSLSHEAAACADDQGRFWEMHARLFEKPLRTIAELSSLGRTVAVDGAAFETCLTSRRHAAAVAGSAARLTELKVGATPTFLIGFTPARGERFVAVTQVNGSLPFAAFKDRLDKVLAAF